MKNIHLKYFCSTSFWLLLFFVSPNLAAQQLRYSNQIFDKVDTLKEVEYARAQWLNNPIPLISDYNVSEGESITEERPLLMDIFMPHSDTLKNRPAIIFMHSGAFLIGSRLNDDMVAMCDSFARKGYVTATIDYRLGMGAVVNRIFGIIIGLRIDEINGYRAAYRGMQDSRAAIRFLKHNAENYGIDTSKIYITGSSAGGILALYNIYLDKEEINPFAFSPPSLGNADTVGIQGYGAKAAAVTSLWGAVESPEIIDNNDTPVFLVHGTEDNIVPFKKGKPLSGIIPPEYSSYAQLNLPETYGSFCIDTVLNSRNIDHESYFVEDEKHEFYGVATGEFKEGGPNAFWDTIQWKTTRFFFEQFKPKANFEYQQNGTEVSFYDNTNESTHSFWDFGDGITAEEKTVVHNYAVSGNYMVKLTTCNKNMACDTLTKSVYVDNSVFAENPLKMDISIYPNPVTQQLKIEGINATFDLSIYDITGRINILKRAITSNNIDVSELQNGIYLLEISNSTQRVTKKFIKTK